MERVAILLSTYNGEKYISDQIDSILNQKGVNVDLYIRDDGSIDRTISILSKYKEKTTIILGENIGWKKSFWTLLMNVPADYDYYAWSDQDDVWMENKLLIATNWLRKTDRPALYCSAQTLVDEKLNLIGLDVHKGPKNKKQSMTLLSSRGCSQVFNQALLKLLQENGHRDNFAHDRWISRVALCVGELFLDSESYILYRQHSNNASGSIYKQTLIDLFNNSIKNYNQKDFYYWYAKELLDKYDDYINPDILDWLKLLVDAKYNFKSKMKLLFSRDFVSENLRGTVLLKIIMFFGIYQ